MKSDSVDSTVAPFLPAGAHGHESAARVFTYWQLIKYLTVAGALLVLFTYDRKVFLAVVNFAICALYVAIISYKLLTVLLSAMFRPELQVSETELADLDDDELPVYTILVPMYKESEVAAKVVNAVGRLDYPQDKLDIKLLLEEDDPETRQACQQAHLPACVDMIVVPHSQPKTKPKACNHGLRDARGEYLVIYDAEDRPESDQLKKAVAAFRRLDAERAALGDKGPEVVCLQGKLNYYNARQNYLTKWFALEYTVWFDLFLPGLHVMGVPIPLGGTSNHFKTDVLRRLGGWDPFNVTEDCDLGIRLHREGYRTKILDSTTWEEANSRLGNWIRQRSRWVKGYIQTHLIHTREWMGGPENAQTHSGKDSVDPMKAQPGGPENAPARGAFRPLRYWRAAVVAALAVLFVVCLAMDWRALMDILSERQLMAPLPNLVFGARVFLAVVLVLLIWGWAKGMWRLGVLGYPSFLATVGGLPFTLLLNPIYWIAMLVWVINPWQLLYEKSTNPDFISHVNLYEAVWDGLVYWLGAASEPGRWKDLEYLDAWSLWSQLFFPLAIALLLANVMFICINVLAIWRRRLDRTVGKGIYFFALLVPLYWVLISIAAWKGFLQLLRPGRAHYWEKTQHGFADEHDTDDADDAGARKAAWAQASPGLDASPRDSLSPAGGEGSADPRAG